MGKFLKWLETNIGEFPQKVIDDDPAMLHPVTFDHAWERGDKEKAQWLLSIGKTAKKYIDSIQQILVKFWTCLNDKLELLGVISLQNNLISLKEINQAIINFTKQINTNNVKNNTNNVRNIDLILGNLGSSKNIISDLEKLDKININFLRNNMKPECLEEIEKNIIWIQSITQKIKEAKSDILDYKLRNHEGNLDIILKKIRKNCLNLFYMLRSNKNKQKDSNDWQPNDWQLHIINLFESIIDRIRINDDHFQKYIRNYFADISKYLDNFKNFYDVAKGEIKNEYNKLIKNTSDLFIFLKIKYEYKLREDQVIGKFYNWLLKENLDNNPGEYWYIKLDDFMSGEDYEKENWVKGVIESATKLLNYIKEISKKSNNNKYYLKLPKASYNKSIEDYNERNNHLEIVRLLGSSDILLNHIISLINSGMRPPYEDFLTRNADTIGANLRIINNSKIINLYKEYLKPEVVQEIDITINFINRMFDILHNDSLRNEVMNYIKNK